MTERSTPRPSTTDDSGVVLARRVVVGRTRLSNRVSAGNLWLRCVQGAERGFERSFGDGGKDSCLPPDWIDIGPVAVRGHEGTAAVDGRLDPISIDVPDRRPDCSEDGSCWFALGTKVWIVTGRRTVPWVGHPGLRDPCGPRNSSRAAVTSSPSAPISIPDPSMVTCP